MALGLVLHSGFRAHVRVSDLATDIETEPLVHWSWSVFLGRSGLYVISLEGRLCLEQQCHINLLNKRLNGYFCWGWVALP